MRWRPGRERGVSTSEEERPPLLQLSRRRKVPALTPGAECGAAPGGPGGARALCSPARRLSSIPTGLCWDVVLVSCCPWAVSMSAQLSHSHNRRQSGLGFEVWPIWSPPAPHFPVADIFHVLTALRSRVAVPCHASQRPSVAIPRQTNLLASQGPLGSWTAPGRSGSTYHVSGSGTPRRLCSHQWGRGPFSAAQAGVGSALRGSPKSLAETSISCRLPRPLPGPGPAWEQEPQYSRSLGMAGHQVGIPPAPQPWGAELQPGPTTQATSSSRGRGWPRPAPDLLWTQNAVPPPALCWPGAAALTAAFWLLAACGGQE